MHFVRPRLVRRTLADRRFAADQRRPVALGLGGGNGAVDGRNVVPVDIADDVPAIGFKAFRRVVGKPAFDMAVDGDAIIVVEGNQFGEFPDAGQRTGFVRDAFHQATVAQEHIRIVIDDGMTVAVEFGGQQFFAQRHADRIA